jgi:hypothetical protein
VAPLIDDLIRDGRQLDDLDPRTVSSG